MNRRRAILLLLAMLLAAGGIAHAAEALPPADWVMPSGYAYTMTCYVQVVRPDGSSIDSPGCRLAVFGAGGECRGAFSPIQGPGGRLFMMIVASNQVEETGLEWQVFDAEIGAVLAIEETLDFVNDGILPSLEGLKNPMQLHARLVDTDPPVLLVSGNPDEWTNQDVVLVASATDEGSGVAALQYRLEDGGEWEECPESGVVVPENGIVYFQAIDQAGNVAAQDVVVDKIDKEAPEAPVATADITAPTNQAVTVAAVFNDDSILKEYSLDGTAWDEYAAPIVLSENGTVYFRGTDAAGNASAVTS